MNAVVGSHRCRSTAAAPLESETGESYVDEILKRLGLLETVVADVRVQVSAVMTLMPTFATKSDLLEVKGELKSDIHAVRLELQALRTECKTDVHNLSTELKTESQQLRTEMQALKTELKGDSLALRAEISAMETRLIRWSAGTMIAIAALAFTAAKYVH